MEVSKIPNLQKCGEILMDIKSKNKKNKIYIFHCTFCNLECDQLKKFSLHIGEEHLNDFEDILKETELKFEAEPEEVKLQSFTDIDSSDIKVFESSIDSKTNINPDPLDTVNAASTAKNAENLICEVKYEIIDQDESAGNMGVLDGTVSISDSDKDENDKDFVFDSDSDEDYKVDVDEAPLKKRKINKNVKKGKKAKLKENSNDSDTDESKDAECNVKKEAVAIKKHKRCKRRWKNIDESKLPIIIKMYKKYEVLWQVNDIAFGIPPSRNETFNKMLEELKMNHNFDKNLDELERYIDYLNYIFCKNKAHELKCELKYRKFKPSTKFYKQLSFLSESQGPFKCSNCNEIIQKYDRYHKHLAQHNGTIPFQCRICEMGFEKYYNYQKHVSRHLGINSYHCDVCGKGYPIKSELDWHLTSHTGAKPFLCSVCGAAFRTRQYYDNHIRRHEKRFRYVCHICKQGFNLSGSFRSHVKTHLNIRDVLCNVCGKGFTAIRYLKRHKLIHEEEKRYKCNVCGKAFAQDAGLRAHRKQHQTVVRKNQAKT